MTLVLLLLLTQPPAFDGLEERVAAYWNLLVRKDKAAALEQSLVAREARNAFIQRREPRIRAWTPVRIEPRSESEALVTVEIEEALPGVPGFHKVQVVEAWKREEGQWRALVRATDPAEVLGQFQTRPPPAPLAGVLRVVPDTMRIHFLNRLRTGAVRLANGLDAPVQIEKLDFDRGRFRLVKAPAAVAPSSYGEIVLEYIGGEIAKDRESLLKVFLLERGTPRTFEVPIVYNYLSPGARALFGLTPEQAEKLKPGDPLRPALPSPGAGEPPEALKKALETQRPPG